MSRGVDEQKDRQDGRQRLGETKVMCGTEKAADCATHDDAEVVEQVQAGEDRLRSLLAASNFKRVSLEMGGKSPQILMSDALSFGDELFEEMAVAAFLNCTAGSRIYADAAIATEVAARLVAVAEKLVLGDPADTALRVGQLLQRGRHHHAVRGWKQSGFGGVEKSLAAFEQWTLTKLTWLRTR